MKTISKPKKIVVMGRHPFWDEDVTVQVKEDGIVTFCNHAGFTTETEEFTVPIWNGDAFEPTGTDYREVLVCDKCNAWSEDGEEWFE